MSTCIALPTTFAVQKVEWGWPPEEMKQPAWRLASQRDRFRRLTHWDRQPISWNCV